MRRVPAAVCLCVLAACGGDSTPLPPLAVGPEWMPLMLDTTGNMLMRRMALWVDTAHVTASPAGYAMVAQKMQMDMKLGGMSTSMQMRNEVDCKTKRMRTVGMDSMSASMKGVPVPDSVAKQAVAQQSGKMSDTTWRDVAAGPMLTAVCARFATLDVPSASAPAATAPAPGAVTPPTSR